MATTSLALAPRLRLAVGRTARRLRQEGGSGLTPSLLSALTTIERHGPLTPSALAERERVQRPTVTKLLDRLGQSGLVQRVADPGDKRSSLVSLAPAGAALLAELRTRKDAYLEHRLEALDASDRAALERAADILERLLEDDED